MASSDELKRIYDFQALHEERHIRGDGNIKQEDFCKKCYPIYGRIGERFTNFWEMIQDAFLAEDYSFKTMDLFQRILKAKGPVPSEIQKLKEAIKYGLEAIEKGVIVNGTFHSWFMEMKKMSNGLK